MITQLKVVEKYKLGFLKLRVMVSKGSKKERIILKIISIEIYLKQFIYKYLLSKNKTIENFLCSGKRIHKVNINGLDFIFNDSPLSCSADGIAQEIDGNQTYVFDNIVFQAGDVFVDIGANIGIVSIYLAKRYPFLKIYSFEPVKYNYDNFLQNIKLNNIPDGIITVENKAVTGDARNVQINFDPLNSGGSTINNMSSDYKKKLNEIESVTLDNIIEKYRIENLKLLKIDCEGSEYEILHNTKIESLKKINHLRGEFHEDKSKYNDSDAVKLTHYCEQYISDVDVIICSQNLEWMR